MEWLVVVAVVVWGYQSVWRNGPNCTLYTHTRENDVTCDWIISSLCSNATNQQPLPGDHPVSLEGPSAHMKFYILGPFLIDPFDEHAVQCIVNKWMKYNRCWSLPSVRDMAQNFGQIRRGRRVPDKCRVDFRKNKNQQMVIDYFHNPKAINWICNDLSSGRNLSDTWADKHIELCGWMHKTIPWRD